VLSPTEGFAGHNRLTHALKVGQVARRLAEKLVRSSPPSFLDSIGGLDPNVTESAGLAHDLGHPPFGHVAEEELNKIIIERGVLDGFEGNAQSFRIVTRLEIREAGTLGLDLTRATLAAILKYPWLKGAGPKPHKFGAYVT
jgi:dGTPase